MIQSELQRLRRNLNLLDPGCVVRVRGIPQRCDAEHARHELLQQMAITGHKTRAVFDRYHIVSPGDLQDAARKLAGTIPGTIAPGTVAPRAVSSDNHGARL